MKTVTEIVNGKSVVSQLWMVRGDDESIIVPLYIGEGDDLAEYTMQPGDTLTLTVREMPSADSPVLLQITSAPGSNRIPIAHADTAQLDPGKYSADIQLLAQDGKRKSIWPDYDPAVSSRYKTRNMQNFVLLAEVTVL